jgi:dethiobiotin synthetase
VIPPAAGLRLAVTGTDTGVGKTLVACALVAALRARGLAVAAMKPVETGVVDRHVGTDAERLRTAAGAVHAADDVCPVVYAEPLAPLVAADRAGRPVDWTRIDAARARLEAAAGAFVVEGAGGLLVPFSREGTRVVDFAALAARWSLDLVVVAADRLGVLNHTLLTVREAERRGLRVRAVVLNAVRAAPADAAEATNLGVLAGLLPAVPVVAFPFAPDAEGIGAARLAAMGGALASLLAPAAPGS